MHRLRRLTAGIAVAAAMAVVATAVPALADPPTGSNGKRSSRSPTTSSAWGPTPTRTCSISFLSTTTRRSRPGSTARHTPTSTASTPPRRALPPPRRPSSCPRRAARAPPVRASCGRTGRRPASRRWTRTSSTARRATTASTSPGASSSRSPTAPPEGPGGVVYVALAKDALTWTTRAAKFGGSNAPASLTKAQLQGIFTCKTTNWKQVGGKTGAIKVYLPQTGSGTLSAWEKFLGITTLGSCVNLSLEENQGESKQFNDPNAVFVYSIADWVAQRYHSPACGVKPAKGQNKFGCDVTGFVALKEIDGIAPTTSAKVPVINPGFPKGFFRTLYDILRWTAKTPDNLYVRLEPFFGSRRLHGFLCTSPVASQDIADYGFISTSTCGSTS